VKTFAIPSSRHTARKNFAENCAQLSVSAYRGGPYAKTQCSQNAFAMARAEMTRSGTVRVNLEKRTVMTSRNLFPCYVLGSGSRISRETYSRGSAAGNSLRKLVRLRSLIRFFAQIAHFLTVSATSAAIVRQN
jgi:hypothetical protein